jgi:hypothetical protein
MSNPGWKKFERRIAAAIGGHRRPVTGCDRNDGDVFSQRFELQCKCRGGQPTYLLEWLKGICATATARGRLGVVVWKQAGRGYDDADALVVLRWQDFVTLVGKLTDQDAADGPPGQPIVSNGSPSQETGQPTLW